jgi:hypothetical protein
MLTFRVALRINELVLWRILHTAPLWKCLVFLAGWLPPAFPFPFQPHFRGCHRLSGSTDLPYPPLRAAGWPLVPPHRVSTTLCCSTKEHVLVLTSLSPWCRHRSGPAMPPGIFTAWAGRCCSCHLLWRISAPLFLEAPCRLPIQRPPYSSQFCGSSGADFLPCARWPCA